MSKKMSDEVGDKMSDKKASDKLLNCPFCGGEAEEQSTYYGGIFMHEVVCKDCGFESKVQTAETPGEARQKAIAAWNQRKPMERILERLEEETKKAMSNSEKAAELGQKYEKHMIFNGAKGTAFEKAIEIVKEEGGLND